MKKRILPLLATTLLVSTGFSQTNVDTLRAISSRESAKYTIRKVQAIEWANQKGLPVVKELNGVLYELQFIDAKGNPQYYATDNADAAATISTKKVHPGGSAGLSLTGSGITVREWDGGSILATHQEFDARVTNVDAVETHYHSTHVAGTIMASGVVANAKGMAYQASLRAFDWNSDLAEMATEGATGALISNHSYGYVRGWSNGTWYGDTNISSDEDYLFGFYDAETRQWDQVANNAPYFLICKSAGNDRGNSGSGHPADGPYDCIGQQGIAKNILTVGAVNDIPLGYSVPTDVVMSSFSSWGPADDGRIKPDIVANGVNIYSTYNTNNTSYESLSGTSMATPSAAGSLALLQQHYHNLKGAYMLSSTLKALVIHTADEAGTNMGPDYVFGWGLMNTERAAAKITEDSSTDVISEQSLANGGSYTKDIVAVGGIPLKVTIVWNDPAGTPTAASLDPITPMLVNDLDLKITQSATTFYPWKLDRNNPANEATNAAENNVDNVEVVYIASPVAGATYTLTVDHDGTLASPQSFSMIISGAESYAAPVANFSVVNTSVQTNTPVNFTDNSLNVPTSWSWSFTPSTITYLNGTSATSANPQVQFNSAGSYSVSLTATNNYGSDSEIKTNYISAFMCTSLPLPYTEDFESGLLPDCWSQEQVNASGAFWSFTKGNGGSNPATAHGGNYNACFKDASKADNITRLILPSFNLNSVTDPYITFWHTQALWSPDQDILTVYYKTSAAGTWNQLVQYTSNYASWTQETIPLPGSSSDYYLCFEGNAKWGYGVCIDDVTVSGTPVILPTLEITDVSVGNGESECFNATDTIYVAGNGTTVELLSGSTVNMIAGQSISFLPGFRAHEGSNMDAWITETASFCTSLPSVIQQPEEKSATVQADVNNNKTSGLPDKRVKIFPNPSNGRFNVELINFEGNSTIIVSNTLGAVVYRLNAVENRNAIELSAMQKGIYFVTVQNGKLISTQKLVIQ
jgi:PKD repeat protein